MAHATRRAESQTARASALSQLMSCRAVESRRRKSRIREMRRRTQIHTLARQREEMLRRCKRIYFRPRTRKLFSPSATPPLIIWTNSFAIQPGAGRARERNFHKIDTGEWERERERMCVCVSCTSPILTRLGLIKTLCVFSPDAAWRASEREKEHQGMFYTMRCAVAAWRLSIW
jgi:hypothetical protein